MLIPLQTVITCLKGNTDILRRFLFSFSCTIDADIESILHNRAVDFENLSKSRTYLICDEEELKNNSFDQIIIYGYFSLAIKILSIPDEISDRTRKELDGFSAKIHEFYQKIFFKEIARIPDGDLDMVQMLRKI